MKFFASFLAVVLAFCVGYFEGRKEGVTDTRLGYTFEQAADVKIAQASEFVKVSGIEVAATWCKKPTMTDTNLGQFWLTCAISAEFYDPATYKVVTTGKDTVLPVGVYTRVENALYLLRRGYKTKDLTVSVGVSKDDPTLGSNAEKVYTKSKGI